MKLTAGIFFLGIVLTIPAIFYGLQNRDEATGKRISKQEGNFMSNAILANSEFSWHMDCDKDNCSVSVSITPAPDSGSISVNVSRPLEAERLNKGFSETNGVFAADFIKKQNGWYLVNLMYTNGGTYINHSKSFYLE